MRRSITFTPLATICMWKTSRSRTGNPIWQRLAGKTPWPKTAANDTTCPTIIYARLSEDTDDHWTYSPFVPQLTGLAPAQYLINRSYVTPNRRWLLFGSIRTAAVLLTTTGSSVSHGIRLADTPSGKISVSVSAFVPML